MAVPVNDLSKAKDRYQLYVITTQDAPGQVVYRYCPAFMVAEVIKMARLHDPEVFMLVMLMVCAGVRPGTGCNTRLTDSSYGPGYKTTYVAYDDGGIALTGIKLDYTASEDTKSLRPGLANPSGIKKCGKIDVHKAVLLNDCIREYLALTKSRHRAETMPLVVNASVNRATGYNEAMTYRNFLAHFKKLCNKYVLPALSDRGGKYAEYAKELMIHQYGPHFFREFFTCRLVDDGETWDRIMHLRGDSSPDSAITYLIKGQIFEELITSTNDDLAGLITDTDTASEEKKTYGASTIRSFPKRL